MNCEQSYLVTKGKRANYYYSREFQTVSQPLSEQSPKGTFAEGRGVLSKNRILIVLVGVCRCRCRTRGGTSLYKYIGMCRPKGYGF